MSKTKKIIIDDATDFVDLDNVAVASKFIEYVEAKCDPSLLNDVTLDFSKAAYYFDYASCSVLFDWFFSAAIERNRNVKLDRKLKIRTRLSFPREDFAYLFTKDSECLQDIPINDGNNGSQTPFSDRLDAFLSETDLTFEIFHSIPLLAESKLKSTESICYPPSGAEA